MVDDDPDILTLVQIMLSMNNFKVEGTSRWEDVNNSITNFKPDLVLLDVSLGGADGRDICKKMHHARETKDIPVILFSANAEMGNYIGDCHAQAFISKPFELAHLLQTIRLHLTKFDGD